MEVVSPARLSMHAPQETRPDNITSSKFFRLKRDQFRGAGDPWQEDSSLPIQPTLCYYAGMALCGAVLIFEGRNS